MLRTVATLLLLVQLRPFAAAAMCVHESLGVEQPCNMPMGTAPASDHHDRQHSTPQTNCALDQLCALTAPPAIPVAVAPLTSRVVFSLVVASPYHGSMHTAEPVAPPVPPPNS